MVEIKKVSSSELAVLTDIARSTFDRTFRHLNDPLHFDTYMAEAFSEEQFRAEYEDANSLFYLVWEDDNPIGYMKLNRGAAQTEHDMEDAIEIQRIYLSSESQGKGIGRMLVERAKAIVIEEGCSTLWLGVWEKNDASIKFYERMGFKAFSEHDFMLGPERQRDILMKMSL